MEIPQTITEKMGSMGAFAYKSGHKDGKLEGQKVSKSKFSAEVNSMGNQVLSAKEKEGYKAPSIEDSVKQAGVFAMGKTHDRNTIKRLVGTLLKTMESLPLPEKKAKVKETPSA